MPGSFRCSSWICVIHAAVVLPAVWFLPVILLARSAQSPITMEVVSSCMYYLYPAGSSEAKFASGRQSAQVHRMHAACKHYWSYMLLKQAEVCCFCSTATALQSCMTCVLHALSSMLSLNRLAIDARMPLQPFGISWKFWISVASKQQCYQRRAAKFVRFWFRVCRRTLCFQSLSWRLTQFMMSHHPAGSKSYPTSGALEGLLENPLAKTEPCYR